MFKLFSRKKKEPETPENHIRDFWDENAFHEFATTLFKKHQTHWNNLDIKNMKQYMTEGFYRHHLLLFKALQNRGRHYTVSSPHVSSIETQSRNPAGDEIILLLQARSEDELVDTESNRVLYTRNSSFVEYWHFTNEEDDWKLSGISQIGSLRSERRREFKQYAASRNLYYTNNYGWLILPQEGNIFHSASFKKSDIQNHMVGYEDEIVQLYHYLPRRTKQKKRYLVGETELHGNYGHIYGMRHGKHSWYKPRFLYKPRGLQYVKTLGADLNRQYEIYASHPEKTESVPILSYPYMQRLLSLGFNLTFEIVGSTLYLYTDEQVDNFEPMYILLQEALKESHLHHISIHGEDE